MVSIVTNLNNPLLDYVKDDPVRPELPKEYRVTNNKVVAVLNNDGVKAVTCIAFTDKIPTCVDELECKDGILNTAIFYTIWTYEPGSGKELLSKSIEVITKSYPNIVNFLTLSPKTKMAHRFHIKNGASVYRINEESVNYKYEIYKSN